jgi:hypothetical protein
MSRIAYRYVGSTAINRGIPYVYVRCFYYVNKGEITLMRKKKKKWMAALVWKAFWTMGTRLGVEALGQGEKGSLQRTGGAWV